MARPTEPNEYGVYEDYEEISFRGKRGRASIELALCEDSLWRWGYSYDLRDPGKGGGGCCGPHERAAGYVTRESAIAAACAAFRTWSERHGWQDNPVSTKEIIGWIDQVDPGVPRQMELF